MERLKQWLGRLASAPAKEKGREASSPSLSKVGYCKRGRYATTVWFRWNQPKLEVPLVY